MARRWPYSPKNCCKSLDRAYKLNSSEIEQFSLYLHLSFFQNHPSRAAPIKEETVLVYIIEAGREGCPIDWARLCLEVGLTQETSKNIQEAVSKVGTSLKPIKNELPEEVRMRLRVNTILMQSCDIMH